MRIAITGRGIVSPIGSGIGAFQEALWAGASGIRPIARFDTAAFRFKQAGEITDFRLRPELEARESADTATKFLLNACSEALQEAEVENAGEEILKDTGVVLGTNFGGSSSGEKILNAIEGEGVASKRDVREFIFQTAADHVANAWSLSGPREVLSLSCSSGTAAICRAAEVLERADASAVLVGGYDAVSPFAWSGLSALRTMTRGAIQPFDKNRSGTIFSEGAGCMILEPLDKARERGATIYAEVLGSATNNNAFHMTAPSKGGSGSAKVMQAALDDADVAPSEIDHINTHGTGTRPNDSTETEAIKTVFGDHAYEMPITSIKSMTGHMMGAAGTVETLAAVASLRFGRIPPTINYSEPDPACDLDVVINEPREFSGDTVLSNSAGIGGCNAAVLIRKGSG